MIVSTPRRAGGAAEPKTTILSWEPGDTIPVDARRTLQVVRVRDDDADQAHVLVVQDLAKRAPSTDVS
jgi:uncharacterized protein with von Willebrand factor type A (vWA) domain